ncbi:MAG TPA: low molecular weight protein-tyrosine-phosphatase [Chlamydiales bacterium]|jgi:protein-tyrosine phosphatase|nr:low molecular weight protein-tyrosine-phosphatase [Chlamydiales bacterium]
MKSVLFVCLGNICRSPALEAVLRHLAVQREKELYVDSCGIGWVHLGESPDKRSFAAASQHGIVIDHHAQQFQPHFFEVFDHIFAVDDAIVEQLKLRAAPEHHPKIELATAYSKKYKGREIPDPYYHSEDGFTVVMEMILDSCEGIFQNLFSSDKNAKTQRL